MKIQIVMHLLQSSAIKSAPEGTLEKESKDALSDLHKDVQENAFEVTRKRETEVVPELHRWLDLFMEWLMRKFVQNVSSNGGRGVAQEGAFDGGLNVSLGGAPQSSQRST